MVHATAGRIDHDCFTTDHQQVRPGVKSPQHDFHAVRKGDVVGILQQQIAAVALAKSDIAQLGDAVRFRMGGNQNATVDFRALLRHLQRTVT